jgi:CRISPR/Cas system-associated protein Csm6
MTLGAQDNKLCTQCHLLFIMNKGENMKQETKNALDKVYNLIPKEPIKASATLSELLDDMVAKNELKEIDELILILTLNVNKLDINAIAIALSSTVRVRQVLLNRGKLFIAYNDLSGKKAGLSDV